MVTIGDGSFPGISGRDGRPLWKRHWDAVHTIAAEELARVQGRLAWPADRLFLDIKVTTPKSRGVYRVFRTYPDGTVKLGTVTQQGLVMMIQPNTIELTSTHLLEFRRELSRKLNVMCQ